MALWLVDTPWCCSGCCILGYDYTRAGWRSVVIANRSYLDHEISEINQRCNSVARLQSVNSNYCVALIGPDRLEYDELRTLLFAMGINVFGNEIDSLPTGNVVLIVHSSSRRNPDIVDLLDRAKGRLPNSPVCYISGRFSTQSKLQHFQDARAVLQAAGIGFTSEVGLGDRL